jgi:hypothetical protein
MLSRKAAGDMAAATGVATAEAVTVEGIFMVAAMVGEGISAAGILAAADAISAAGISVAVGATSAVDRRSLARLRRRVFAAIVLSPSITQGPCER